MIIMITSSIQMSEFIDSTLDRALCLLGELLEVRDHPTQHWVICGGSALLALGLVRRTTQDVDILARIVGGQLETPRPMPEWLRRAADDVGQQLDLPRDWLNDEVAEETLFHCGLPPGLQQRLTPRSYGPRLEIYYISRRDQVFLKLHAAVDRDGGRHLEDLLQLKPAAGELLDAARWACGQDPSEGFRFNLKTMLTQLGHAELVSQF